MPIWIHYDILFNESIIFGKLDVCKYYYFYRNYRNTNIYDSFKLCCSNGYLEIAK